MPRILELFSGTGSVGKAFAQEGWDVTSVDISDALATPTFLCDIMNFDISRYSRGYFDHIHASPPCTMYSRARTTAKTPRDLETADRLVQRSLDIIAQLQPFTYTIENPQTGLLKTREVIQGWPFIDTSYCRWGASYKKVTRVWTNLAAHGWSPPGVCCAADPCPHYAAEKRHPSTAQRAPGMRDGYRMAGDSFDQGTLYALPALLCQSIAKAAGDALSFERV